MGSGKMLPGTACANCGWLHIYLFIRKAMLWREKDREGEGSSTCWSTLQTTASARGLGQAKARSPVLQLDLHKGAEAQAHGQCTGSQVEQLGYEPTPILDAGVPSGNFPCYTRMSSRGLVILTLFRTPVSLSACLGATPGSAFKSSAC